MFLLLLLLSLLEKVQLIVIIVAKVFFFFLLMPDDVLPSVESDEGGAILGRADLVERGVLGERMKLLRLTLFLLRVSSPLCPRLRALLPYTVLTIHLKVHLRLYVGAFLLMICDVRDGLLDLLAELPCTSSVIEIVVILSIVIALLRRQIGVHHAYLLSMHSLVVPLHLLLNEGHFRFVRRAFGP